MSVKENGKAGIYYYAGEALTGVQIGLLAILPTLSPSPDYRQIRDEEETRGLQAVTE